MKRVISSLTLATFLFASPAFADDIPATLSVDTSGVLPAGVTVKDVAGKEDPKATFKVERILSWNEGNGANIAIFATTEKSGQKDGDTWTSKALHVATYNVVGGKYTKLQTIIEAVQPCNVDLTAKFLETSIGLTNLDGDDKGELTFGYVTRCAGDMSPMSMKVLMLEGKDKHALRGQSVLDLGDGMVEGGDYKVDFKKAPKELVEYAKRVWESHKKASF